MWAFGSGIFAYFYPRSPCGERLHFATLKFVNPYISIHALLAESDINVESLGSQIDAFLSTLSLRRATRGWTLNINGPMKFLSTLSLRRATVIVHSAHPHKSFLSTLSLRRATVGASEGAIVGDYFYPRSPCGERHNIPPDSVLIIDISIHALLAESDYLGAGKSCNVRRISIHALLAESDHGLYSLVTIIPSFLSTLSLRRATA